MKVTKNDIQEQPESMAGLYSYSVTGYGSHLCEGFKHSLLLNTDSTFIFKVHCTNDSTVLFPGTTIKKGKWTKQKDSIFHFTCSDTTTFDIELLSNQKLKIIRPYIDEQINFQFVRDTTQGEML